MRRDYGWPDEFRAEDWYADGPRIQDAAWETENALLEGTGLQHEQLVHKWKADPDTMPEIRMELAADFDPTPA